MPTFETPEPISVDLRLGLVAADVRITATDRADTTIEVRPVDPHSKRDLKVAEQTRIDFADGTLVISAPKTTAIIGRPGSIDVAIGLPTGSRLQGGIGLGQLRTDGRLGDCRFTSACGEMRLDHIGAADLHSSAGAVVVDHADGSVEVAASSGSVRLSRVEGAATIKSSNGDSWIGEAGGAVQVKAANGAIAVERAHADVTAKTANGNVRVGEVARGRATLETAVGNCEIGVRSGTAAWLELNTVAGRVRNELATAAGPEDTDETVEVRASTHVGDIIVRRA